MRGRQLGVSIVDALLKGKIMLRLFRLCLPALVLGCAAHAALAQNTIYTPEQYIYPSLLGTDGNLYGTAPNGMFEINLTTGAHTIANSSLSAVTLCSIAPDGSFIALNGNTVGKVTMAGVVTTLATLPYSTVCPVLANNGDYYGGNSTGGSYNQGYLYQMTAAGAVTVLYSFTGGVDGIGPGWPMVQGSDGNLYGVSGNASSTTNEMFRYSAGTGVTAYSSTKGIVGPIYENSSGDFSAMAYGDSSSSVPQATLYTISPQGAVISTVLDVDDGSGNSAAQGNLLLGGGGVLYLEENYFYYSDLCFAEGNYLTVYRGTASGVETAFGFYNDGYGEYGDVTDYYTISEFLAGNGTFYGGYSDANYYNNPAVDDCTFNTTLYEVYSENDANAVSPAVEVTPAANRVLPGKSTTVSWDATSAFSDSLQQCYGYNGLSGKLGPTGSQTLTFPSAGTYSPTVVCGGTQTGIGQVIVGGTSLYLGDNLEGTTLRTGEPLPLYAIINNIGTPAPTGKVEFLYQGTVLATAAVNSAGEADYTASTTGVPAGTYTLTAKYLGDGNYAAATSEPLSITLNSGVATTTTLSASQTTVGEGATVSLTAGVSNANDEVNAKGTVSLYVGSLKLLTAALSKDDYPQTATFSASTKGVTPGAYSVTAQYSGDPVYAPSTSSPLAITVQAPDTITVSASPNPVPAGDNFTLSATVANIYGTPTGSVIFSAGSTELAATTLNGSGVATAMIPAGTLAAGTYSVTAAYAGDSKNPSGTSPAYSLTVQ